MAVTKGCTQRHPSNRSTARHVAGSAVGWSIATLATLCWVRSSSARAGNPTTTTCASTSTSQQGWRKRTPIHSTATCPTGRRATPMSRPRVRPSRTGGGPAGGGYSTVGDLLRFAGALLGHHLLSPAMTAAVLRTRAFSEYGYGFGVGRRGQTLITFSWNSTGLWLVCGVLGLASAFLVMLATRTDESTANS